MTLLHDVASKLGLGGQPVKRREDRRLLVSSGRFVDDIHLPGGTLHLVFVRSSQAHARLNPGETRAAMLSLCASTMFHGSTDAVAEDIHEALSGTVLSASL